ncbi:MULTISPECIES: hypothetical protein [Leclercia]|uniref:hypothetical protein n=1 Tax=Leclercia TaxID=83654 RepID=UPI0021F0BF46|nr:MULTISPECIES: hypothetical protein [Leclercia]UYM53603.1 hypothetical protein N5937_00215 [Leclercia adecarboxylata]
MLDGKQYAGVRNIGFNHKVPVKPFQLINKLITMRFRAVTGQHKTALADDPAGFIIKGSAWKTENILR